MSNVHGVGDMYVWLCMIVSSSMMCGFVFVEQVELVCVFMLHLASGDWDVCCLFWVARSAVTIGPRSHGSE